VGLLTEKLTETKTRDTMTKLCKNLLLSTVRNLSLDDTDRRFPDLFRTIIFACRMGEECWTVFQIPHATASFAKSKRKVASVHSIYTPLAEGY